MGNRLKTARGEQFKPIHGSIAAGSGAGSTVYCIKFAQDSNNRLDRICEELND